MSCRMLLKRMITDPICGSPIISIMNPIHREEITNQIVNNYFPRTIEPCKIDYNSGYNVDQLSLIRIINEIQKHRK